MAVVLNWLVALAPVLVLMLMFEWLDVFHLLSLPELATLLLLGALAATCAYPISGRLLDALPMGFSFYSRYVAPWVEEALKACAVLYLFWRNRIGYKVDAAISGFAIGAGFSVIENCFYLLRLDHLNVGVWLVRGLGTAVMHGGTVAVLATLSHHLSERATRERAGLWHFHILWFVPGYLAAVAIHTAFNALPDQPLIAMLLSLILVPGALMAIFSLGAGEARHWLVDESRQHGADLAQLRAGQLPEGESARLVAAFVARPGYEATAPLVLRYWEVHTEIVLRAEQAMLARTAGERKISDAAADYEKMARLRAIETELGKTRVALLRPLLPFSRNDFWEIAEFRRELQHSSGSVRDRG